MKRVIVVGAGISGLATAYRLSRACPDLDVRVLESSPRVGGNIRTERSEGFVAEAGPNGFLDGVSSTVDLARELGLGARLIAASEGARKNRYLFLHDAIQPLPGGIGSFLRSPLLSWRGKVRLLMEPFVRRGTGGPESVAEFARRRFGREAADVFVDALVTGIHGGDPEILDVRAAFPRMSGHEATAGSVVRGMLRAGRSKRRAARERGERPQPQRMWSFPGGLQELIDALAAALPNPPAVGCDVSRLERPGPLWRVCEAGGRVHEADAVVLACPADVQKTLLAPLDSGLATELGSIEYNRIAVVILGFRLADVPRQYDGFGFIAPENTGEAVLGVQWCSTIFPGRAPDGMTLWRALCGGWRRGDVLDWSDDQLVDAALDVLRRAQQVTARPARVRVVRWPRAIPQYRVGHVERVIRIDERASRHPGLFLTGNSLRGVAINDCTAEATRVASRVTAFLRGE